MPRNSSTPGKNTIILAFSTLPILLNVEFRSLWYFAYNEKFFKKKLITNTRMSNKICMLLNREGGQNLSFKLPYSHRCCRSTSNGVNVFKYQCDKTNLHSPLPCVIICLISTCPAVLVPSQGHTPCLILLNVALLVPGRVLETVFETVCGKTLCKL